VRAQYNFKRVFATNQNKTQTPTSAAAAAHGPLKRAVFENQQHL
jgi:hypothetical protein